MKQNSSVAITGIDGAGKSTISAKISKALKTRNIQDSLVMHCPVFHETPNAPLSELSRDLDAFSTIADELKSVELKAVAQFIQTTLFGYVKDNLAETFQPDLLIHERHAVIDCYAYGRFYAELMASPPDQKQFEAALIRRLEMFRPGAWQSILNWIDKIGEGYDSELSLWNFHHHIKQIFSLKGTALMQALEQTTNGTLPDVLIILDANPDLAAKRIELRDDGKEEFHEQNDMLQEIRHRYFEAVDLIKKEYPDVRTFIVSMNDQTSVDETVKTVTEYISNLVN